MPEPGRQSAAGIVLHRLHLGCCTERVADPFRRPLVVGRQAHPNMAVVDDRVVRAVGPLDLVQRLGDQETLDAVVGYKGQRGLEETEAA